MTRQTLAAHVLRIKFGASEIGVLVAAGGFRYLLRLPMIRGLHEGATCNLVLVSRMPTHLIYAEQYYAVIR